MSTARDTLLRRLEIADLRDVVALQRAVTGALPQGYVREKSESALRGYRDGAVGLAYGIGERGALQGVSLLRIPNERHPNPDGLPFPIVPPAEWTLHAALVENTLLLPAARGRGHQRAFLERRIADARAAGMKWLCGGGHLENVPSWRNLLANGFAVVGMRLDYGFPVIGLLYGFDPEALASDPADAFDVPLREIAVLEAAFAKGYVGVRIEPDGRMVCQRRTVR